MKKIIVLFIVIFVSLFMIGKLFPNTEDINTLPMYGGIPKNDLQKKADDEFIKTSIEIMGSRDKVIEYTLKKAWELNYKNDLDASMKRFNQVFLLDPNNANAYFGFGIISGKKGQIDEAIKYLHKALELAPENAEIIYNLGFSYSQKSYNKDLSQTEKNDALKNAVKYFEYATQKDSTVVYYYGEWANALYELGQYKKASEILKIAEKLDAKKSQKLRQMINKKLKNVNMGLQ